MDKIAPERTPRSRLLRFFARRRAKREQRLAQLLSNPEGSRQLRATQTQREMDQTKATAETLMDSMRFPGH